MGCNVVLGWEKDGETGQSEQPEEQNKTYFDIMAWVALRSRSNPPAPVAEWPIAPSPAEPDILPC